VSASTGDPVADEEIVLGYEVAPGRHVTFEREEVADLRPESTKAIAVLDFVELDAVDPVYFDRTYWLGPDGEAAREPYELLLAAMEERKRVAIGHVVMRNKGRLAAIRPMDGLLAMSTMRYADEVVERDDVAELPTERRELQDRALDLALQVVDTLTAEWEPEKYPNTYVSRSSRQAIEDRAAGLVPEAVEVGETSPGDRPDGGAAAVAGGSEGTRRREVPTSGRRRSRRARMRPPRAEPAGVVG
jgi:DNA end-binding protein Ku